MCLPNYVVLVLWCVKVHVQEVPKTSSMEMQSQHAFEGYSSSENQYNSSILLFESKLLKNNSLNLISLFCHHHLWQQHSDNHHKIYTNLTTPFTNPAAIAFTDIPSAAREKVAHVIVSGQTIFLINLPLTDHNLSSLALLSIENSTV